MTGDQLKNSHICGNYTTPKQKINQRKKSKGNKKIS